LQKGGIAPNVCYQHSTDVLKWQDIAGATNSALIFSIQVTSHVLQTQSDREKWERLLIPDMATIEVYPMAIRKPMTKFSGFS
jgi:hypothetical protein